MAKYITMPEHDTAVIDISFETSHLAKYIHISSKEVHENRWPIWKKTCIENNRLQSDVQQKITSYTVELVSFNKSWYRVQIKTHCTTSWYKVRFSVNLFTFRGFFLWINSIILFNVTICASFWGISNSLRLYFWLYYKKFLFNFLSRYHSRVDSLEFKMNFLRIIQQELRNDLGNDEST